ncbi:MAG TPA: D-alanyl-D-alanine endopeptidase [Syntrophaceae bacterium]|jgi:D-alanyl-D-alanine endopeptidase (penicillin-binding protein 7)|nr:D-alanyl-D-alanine endopeptidase [Syntrophaceae bacterium]
MTHRFGTAIAVILLILVMLSVQGTVGISEASKSLASRRSYSRIQGKRAPQKLVLRSASALVADQRTGECLVQKQAETVLPIASITKLMTAMVVLDAKMNIGELLTIVPEDVDTLRHSRSRLRVNTSLTRGDALLLALMASENRAAHALGRTYPGGLETFIAAMNTKAQSLGLAETRFDDPTGISSGNVSSARDLARMVDAAYRYRLIREFTTRKKATIHSGHRTLEFCNSNRLIRSPRWHIGLSKTGFIDEAGRCLVMQAHVANRPVLIVLLDSQGKLTRYGDANRIKQWMEGPYAERRKHRGFRASLSGTI